MTLPQLVVPKIKELMHLNIHFIISAMRRLFFEFSTELVNKKHTKI
jgi:hypothetical protein